MIARIMGNIEEVSEHAVLIATDHGIGYEILVPAVDLATCSGMLGEDIVFHTIHLIEGDPSRGQVLPRLIGFLTEGDREFFRAFTKVKGIGVRKALRALVRPIAEIASAIESKDAKSLVALPEIGKRTAETIIAELNGKVADFAEAGEYSREHDVEPAEMTQAGAEAVAALVQLGEKRSEAKYLVDRVLSVAPEIDSAEKIIQQVYKLKG